MHLFFDIETIPADESLREVVFELAKKRAANSEQVEHVKPLTKDFIWRQTALSGDFGRIFCIGYALGDEDVDIIKGEEKEILGKWWEVADQADLFIGHNIMDFDLNFIFKRSIIHKIKPSAKHLNLSFARYKNYPIFDTMMEWNKWSFRAAISLDKLAKVLGLPTSKDGGINGSKVYDAYLDGKHEEIYEYCKRDVQLTRQVYKRMVFA